VVKLYPFLAAIPFLWLGGTNAPDRTVIDPALFTGNIRLTLKHGVWKLWEDKPTYQDITLDMSCDRGKCQPEVWGYAPKFNKEVDHRGMITATTLDNAWRLRVKMNIQSHPWKDEVREGIYDIEMVPYQGTLLGSYAGTLGKRDLQNQVNGTISPAWPTPVANHLPLQPQEHPRLIFRASELNRIRERSKTPIGQKILTELDRALKSQIYYQGYVPNGGYHATGHCFLALLHQDRQKAAIAWQIIEKSRANPGKRVLEQSPIVAGVALAYDLCYNLWDGEQRQELTRWLSSEGKKLLKGGSPKEGWNGDTVSNWNARARGAAGLAALAILGESLPEDPLYSPPVAVQKARRQIDRYFSLAFGNGGFGTEGDLYSTEPMILSVFPFLQAYRNVMGQDLVTGSHASGVIPNYLTRAVPGEGGLPVPPYGRHSTYIGVPLFSMAVGLVPEQLLPALKWRLEGEKELLNPFSPHVAPFLIAGYPLESASVNPEKTLNRVLVDEDKGFYAFRNRWQDGSDFIASIYLKRRFVGGWSFPEVGSVRIWGLGGHWATVDSGGEERIRENVVILPNTRSWRRSEPIAFHSDLKTGSGVVTLKTDTIELKEAKITGVRSFAVDYSGASGSPGLFVLLDALVGSVDESAFRGRTWVMNTEGKVRLGQNRLAIAGPDGSNLEATFITPVSVRLQVEKTATGSRILARGEDDFLVVMTVQSGTPPQVKATGTGRNTRITVGQQEIAIDNGTIKLGK
jgi:hypothetical protein